MLRRGIALAITAGSLVLTSSQPTATRVVAPRGGDGDHPQRALYTETSKEYYLTQAQADFAKPGYHIKVNSVTIGADRKPVADVNLTDDLGAPLDRLGVQTPGTCSTSFVIAWYNPNSRDYTSYRTRTATGAAGTVTQAAADSGGTFKDIDIGHFTYTFGTVLPATFDKTKTTTVGVYGTRTMPTFIPELGGKTYNANTEFDFRPDGAAVTDVWDQIRETNSCNTCHDPLVVHGRRQDAKLCVLCHQPQTTDAVTGNVLDMRIMIHKIHMGPNLPAGKPYQIGNNNYGDITFPQDIRNCANCHAGRVASTTPTQSDTWYTKPSRAACGSCHDDLNFVTGANHPGGIQADDSACASCHNPEGSKEWDAGIKTAHTVPDSSKQLPGLNAAIVGVTNVGPNKKPTVTFKLTNGDGSIVDPAHIGASASLSLLLAGPTTDYGDKQTAPAQPISESAVGASFNGTVATYTFTKPIPANATGTWAVAVQTRRTITFNPAPVKGPATFTEGAFNPVTYIAVTDGGPVARRTVVSLDKCNDCHDRLATTFSHGGQRIAIEFCVFCHNPNADDSARRTAADLPAESISFKRMIHRIHTGENLTQDYTIFGFGCPGPAPGCSPAHFNEVTYPGNTKDCLACHTASSTYSLPLDTGTIPTITNRDYFTPQGPATAACLGCHDNVDAAAHAYLNTVTSPFFAEACATCHGTGKDWDVVKEHAQ
jgi:OmcA/MtrC family decaheme c-type cytochrome